MLDSDYIYTGGILDGDRPSIYDDMTWWEHYWEYVILASIVAVVVITVLVCYMVNRARADHSIPRKVTFYGYGEQEFKYNSYIVPIVPTKEGYTFCGWYKDTAFLEPLKSTDRAKRDIILYPKWEKER